MRRIRHNKHAYNISDALKKIYKVGGMLEYKTLRWSREKVHPRKILISISIPVVGKYSVINSLPFINELKERTIYKGCITEIKQTSPKYCSITFSFVLKNLKYVDLFTNLLCKLAFNVKKEIESCVE